MGKIGIALISLIVGLAGGAFLLTPLIGGAMMGAGAGTGMSLGTCSTVKAAQELDLLTAEQVDQVLNRVAEDISDKPVAEGQEITGSAAACDKALAELLPEKGE